MSGKPATMAVFDEDHYAQIVVTENSISDCKLRVAAHMEGWIRLASELPGGALAQFLVFVRWHYHIAQDGQIVETGRISDLPSYEAMKAKEDGR